MNLNNIKIEVNAPFMVHIARLLKIKDRQHEQELIRTAFYRHGHIAMLAMKYDMRVKRARQGLKIAGY